ncbi:MAG: sugar phosphate nucleotidyltransferase [Solirubrobacterales bacterium]
MQALILAGGEGTRLRPLTMTAPKPVVPLANRPFVSYMIDWLYRHGIDEIVMSCGFLADGVRHVLGTGKLNGVTIRYVDEPEPLGTAGAVKFAEPVLGERFAVLNGDVLTDLDMPRLREFHEQRGAVATLGLVPVEDPSSYGVVVTDDQGRVREFLEKPAPGTAPTNHINAGMYVLEHEVLNHIDSGRAVSFEREVFPSLVGAGLCALPLDGYWMDIGTPNRYLQATRDILRGAVETPVSPSGDVNGATPPVLIGQGCEISPGARVGPDATLGDGCRVGSGAEVRASSLHNGVVVEEDAVVRDSIMGSRARIGAGARLEGETIIGEDAVVPPGTHLTGGRLPGA